METSELARLPKVTQAFTIFSDQLLNINVCSLARLFYSRPWQITQHFVRTLVTLSKTWSEDFYSSQQADGNWRFVFPTHRARHLCFRSCRPPEHPYFVDNRTGLALSYWCENGVLCRVAAEEKSAIDGLSMPSVFDVDAHTAGQLSGDDPGDANTASQASVSFQLVGVAHVLRDTF